MRIIVGMSGGVDSALSAALLQRQGFEVIGVTLQLYDYKDSVQETDLNKQHCHPLEFIRGAQETARHLGIEHHVVDKKDLFRHEIVEHFMSEYQKGKTPLPCAKCNREVKTTVLYNMMQELGAEALATGHYVRRIETEDGIQMHQGQDPKRDQSFFLFALKPEHLARSYFPLGSYSKDETREQALNLSLPVAQTPASQDLCFISKKSYKDLFVARPGEIYHIDGFLLGEHQGLERYTIGQRQGLGVGGSSEPLYVIALDTEQNRVIVGEKHHLACSQLILQEVNWLALDLQKPDEPTKVHGVSVKVRSSGGSVPAHLTLERGLNRAIIDFIEPYYAVAPGQACVFYQGTRLLGGGWIA